jgi:hypothetical protein
LLFGFAVKAQHTTSGVHSVDGGDPGGDESWLNQWPQRFGVRFHVPQLRDAKCPEEYARALIARDRLKELGAECIISIIPTGRSCFSLRGCVVLKVGDGDLAERAVEEGWGQRWNGRWPKPNWCPPPKHYKPRSGC